MVATAGYVGGTRRTSSVAVMKWNEKVVELVHSGEAPCERMHHDTCLFGDSAIGLFGGRTNPNTPLQDIWVLDTVAWTWEQREEQEPWPEARWRHTFTAIHRGSKGVLIGGRGVGNRVIEDIWVYTVASNTWDPLPVSLPPLHSHSAVAVADDEILIYGGLTREHALEQPQLYRLNVSTLKLTEIQLCIPASLIPRFSHDAVLMQLQTPASREKRCPVMVLVGGYTSNYCYEHILCYDIQHDDWVVPECTWDRSESPYNLFVRHRSVLVEENRILVVGGGALCFSFGPKYNKNPLLIEFSDCVSGKVHIKPSVV